MQIELKALPLKKLGVRPLVRLGNMQLVTRDEAERIINYCTGNEIAVLGIEAFKLLNVKQIMPDMDWILDCSCFYYEKLTFSKKSTDAARKFILSAPYTLYFEFVLESTSPID